jgi:hypothetical protein
MTEWIELPDLEAAAAGQAASEILFPGNLGETRLEPSYMAPNWLRHKLPTHREWRELKIRPGATGPCVDYQHL